MKANPALHKKDAIREREYVIMKGVDVCTAEHKGDTIAMEGQFIEPRRHHSSVWWVQPYPAKPIAQKAIVVNREMCFGSIPWPIDRRTGIQIECPQGMNDFGRR